ncbi:unnamed protein product [Allacma fusca]|uniref:Tyr recombinase domain-containing protein n=1 Tax=Allacma fusca TaxID=39272 RepID=A0A8J2PYZ7_9HEXA|nr:unnamed protein product [Allacma fusca]
MKGIRKTRPPKPRYNQTWDPSVVLHYLEKLEPLDGLTLEQLTYKTIGLISLVTAHPVQSFSKIMLDDLQLNAEGIEIRISAAIKTSKPNSPQPLLYLPFFRDHPHICAARTISAYVSRTSSFRDASKNQLFLGLPSPHVPVTSQTNSRWIKAVLKSSGIDTNIFCAHSVRHAATSAASRGGLSLDLIRQRAGWSATSSVFARFYNRPIQASEDSFARTVFQL